ncbi:hypothetical protein D9V84_10520 [Bacteroidetes/Chlorobi group bacterium Naka2016]|jgi:phage-related protein|nr:MAG: hypothetical protein D9V84_10520 [Bacteroidetes/Chlorobi group bacterium Naka2016]
MASSFQVTFDLIPIFDANSFNGIINSIKDSLGPLGKSIKVIDANEIKTTLDKVKSSTKETAESFSSIGTKIGEVTKESASRTRKLAEEIEKIGEKSKLTSESIKNSFLQAFSGVEGKFKNIFAPMLGVFGGNLLTQGLTSIVGGFNEIYEAGKRSLASFEKMSVVFAQAGKSGDELNKTIKETNQFAVALAQKFALPISKVREFSMVAAGIGGATGKANQDLTTLGIVIEEVTQGLVSGEMAIRLFSKGVADPESQFALGRLTKQFPALAAALKNIKDPAEATKTALQFFAPALSKMEEVSEGAIGSVQKLQNALNMIKTALGKVVIEAASPFVQGFSNYIIPIFQKIVNGISSLINSVKPLQPVFVSVGLAAGALTTSLLALQGIKVFTNLAVSATQFGLSILQKVIPALVTENALTGTLVLQKQALSIITIKETAINLANAGSRTMLAGATGLLTAAQTALNAAFVASPIGWVVVGVGALVAGMVLLYKNVESVRKVFDTAWEGIAKGAEYAWQIIKKLGEIIWEIGKVVFQILIMPFQLMWEYIKAVGSAIGSLIASIFGLSDAGSVLSDVFSALGKVFDWIMNGLNNILAVVKAVSSAISNFVSGIGSSISKLLQGDIAGFIAVLGSAGEKAGEAFTDKLTEELNQKNFEEAGEKIKEAIEKSSQIQLQIDKQASVQNLLKEYEEIQNQISGLTLKSQTTGISEEEKTKLEELKKKALETSNAIAEIVPEARAQMKTIVDDTGQLRSVWDININKAKEYTDTLTQQKSIQNITEKFTNAIQNQAEALSAQKQHLDELRQRIQQTTDPQQVEELTRKYNELASTFDKNKQILVDSFVQGAKAGLMTNDMVEKIAKSLGITSEEARKIPLAKELEEANKQGKITPELIEQLAKKYHFTKEQVRQILEGQKKITEEINRSNLAAQDFATTLSWAKQMQEEGRGIIIKAIADLKAGRISQEEYNKKIAEGFQKIKDGAQTARELNAASKDQLAIEATRLMVADQTAVKEEKATKEKKTQLEIELELYELTKKRNDETIKSLENEIDRNNLLAGRTERNAQDELKIIQAKENAYKKQFDTLASLIEKHKIKIDQFGKVSFLGNIKKEEAEKVYSEFQGLKTQIEENENNKLRIGIRIKAEREKLQEDIRKAKEEIDKLLAENKLLDIETKVKLGLATESEATRAKIEKIQFEINQLQKNLKIPIGVEILADPQAFLEYQRKISQIQKLKQDLALETKNLQEQLAEEKISLVFDEAEKEKILAIKKAKETYEKEILLAKDNIEARTQAYMKYIQTVSKAEEEYLQKSQKQRDTLTRSFFASMQAFADVFTQDTINPIEERAKSLHERLQALSNTKTEKEIENINKEEKELIASMQKREVSVEEYYKKVNELDKKRTELQIQNATQIQQVLLKTQLSLTRSFQAMAKTWNEYAQSNLSKFIDSHNAIVELQKQIETNGSATEEQVLELAELHRQQAENFKNFVVGASATALGSFTAMLASGASLAEAFKKGLLTNILDIAEKSILSNIPVIYSTFFAQLGVLGLPAAIAAIAIVTSALELAKSALAAYQGVVDIQGPGTETSDSIPAWLSKGESVITARATRAEGNKELFLWLNKTGRPAIEFYLTQQPETAQKLISKYIQDEKEIISKQKSILLEKIILDNLDNSKKFKELNDNIREGFKQLSETIRNAGYVRKTINEISVDVDFNAKEIINKVRIDKESRLKRL